MENITLGQISAVLIFIIGLIGAVATIVKYIKNALDTAFKPFADKLEKMEKSLGSKIDRVDKNATMNYLVRCFDDLNRGIELDSVAILRLKEQYEHYTQDLNGNTYIKDEYDKLRSEGKL